MIVLPSTQWANGVHMTEENAQTMSSGAALIMGLA